MKNLISTIFFSLIGIAIAFVIPLNANIQKDELLLIIGAVVFVSILFPVKKRLGHTSGMVTQYGLQYQFDNVRKSLRAAGLSEADVDNAVLSQSEIRLEQLLTATQNVFFFPILDNASSQATVRPTEKRLTQQDAFFCSNMGIYLAKAASATDTAFKLETYPNSVTFATGGATPAPLNTFYNGRLNIKINKSQIVVDYPVYNFYQAPQTQLTAATNSPITQFDPAQVALWNPSINFIGSKGNEISITLPSNVSAVDANTYIVIKFQGILAQNVTVVS